ncbi:MAG: thiamine pyrophosphate-binding protein [Candidatus Cloacimonetes bacterium]|jgi:phosphonopyruvate decarboxylase|nr:thiamine pyrophosphate-binding protein [Candidatus Cloacimonadota bacterium]
MMIGLDKIVSLLQKENLGPVMGVPCSVFKDFLNYIIDKKSFEHFACSSEGESLGIAAGFALAGKLPIIYMQNDGYGNAINPLSSLQLMYEIPALLMISWRGEPGKKDAPQHELMGETLLDLLSTFKIPYSIINEGNVDSQIINAKKYMKENQKPFA